MDLGGGLEILYHGEVLLSLDRLDLFIIFVVSMLIIILSYVRKKNA